MSAVLALSPSLAALPAGNRHDGGGSPIEEVAVAAGTLFLVPPGPTAYAAVERALAIAVGPCAKGWRLAHDALGAPLILPVGATTPSLASAGAPGVRALLLGTGRIGVDVETLPRVALNASANDDWLGAAERALLRGLSPPHVVVELACRWVLREAYGKALGRGLDLPLARLAFTVRAGRIALPSDDGRWRFALHRRGDLILGTAVNDRSGR